MSRAVISGFIVVLLAVSVASAASVFGAPPADDFCFGYAICQ